MVAPTGPVFTRMGTAPGLERSLTVSTSGLTTTLIHTRPCQLMGWSGFTTLGSAVYAKLYDLDPLTVPSAMSSGIAGNCAVNIGIPGNAAGGGSNWGGPAASPYEGVQFNNGMFLQFSSEPGLATLSGSTAGVTIINLFTR